MQTNDAKYALCAKQIFDPEAAFFVRKLRILLQHCW